MKLKIRINELARELEVKPNAILDLLPEFGVDEKKTHSSSIDEDVAIAIKHKLGITGNSGYVAPTHSTERADEHGGVAVAEDHADGPSVRKPRPAPDRGEGVGVRPPHETPPPAGAAGAAPVDHPAEKSGDAEPVAARAPRVPLRPPLAGALRPPLATGPRAAVPPPVSTPPPAPALAAPPPAASATASEPAAPVVIPPATVHSGSSLVGPGAPPERPAGPRAPAAPAQPAPSRPAGPGAPQAPSAGPGQPRVIPARDVPIFRPGQVISGPRQPLPPPGPGERPAMEGRDRNTP
ncbi:MAG: translation initiation factor IF-2 N-terminal domain-containing protein, partial [Bryobacteraceae bacterium]|nr:translation initiation factor IF-2 N-terminal domain-containing protein [Bryobacteraceae bacterium]